MSELSLTNRELDIIECLLNGQTAKQTARKLSISSRTVERHLENIKDKLRCRTKLEIVNIITKRDFHIKNLAISSNAA